MKNVSRASGPSNPIQYNGEKVGYGCDNLHIATTPCWLARLVIVTSITATGLLITVTYI